MSTWQKSEAPMDMEAVAGLFEIRGVIRSPSPDIGPEQGFDFRFSFRRPPTVPGADTPVELTPWMFASREQFARLVARCQECIRQTEDAPPSGKPS